MSSEFHERREKLSEVSLDMKRAIDSMMEELEAIDWYRQRMQACSDPKLRAILDHHQREEVEHFAMLLEWCRRNDADFRNQLGTYLFSEGDILEVEEAKEEQAKEEQAKENEASDRHGVPETRTSARKTLGAIQEE